MSVNVKMGAEISGFVNGVRDSQNVMKGLNAEMKAAEAEFKATGDAEQLTANKTRILNDQLNTQKSIVDQAKSALKAMKEAGIDPTDAAYQRLNVQMLNAQAGMNEAQAALNGLGASAQAAGVNLEDIGKNVAWDNVTEGLNKLTEKLESAAKLALKVGKAVAKSAMDSTQWADDILTRSTQYGIDAETLQRMENVADYIDTDVDTILTARDKLARNRESLGELLGIDSNGKSVDEVFWEAGEAIMNLGNEFDKTEISQKLFGRSWRELIPLFTAGREEYESMMESQNVLTNEQIENLGKADDAFKSIQHEWERMKNEFWSNNAETITGLLQWILDNADGVKIALGVIAGGFGLLKVGEFAANISQIVNGLKSLGIIKSGAEAAVGLAGKAATTIGSGISAVQAITGGAAVPAAALLAGGYAGFKMIEANLNDENLNVIYGQSEGDGGIIDTISEQAAKAAKEYWDVYQETGSKAAMDARDKLFEIIAGEGYENVEQGVSLIEQVFDNLIDENDVDGMGERLRQRWSTLFENNPVETPVTPEVDPGAASFIAEQIGAVTVPIIPGWGSVDVPEHANGLWSVPYDGYLAELHRGERVIPAREVAASRNFSSNLYIESMYMTNGQDAEGLAAAMAAAQRRTMSGYGS